MPRPPGRATITPHSPLGAARLDLADAYPAVEPVLLHAMSWAAELGVRAVSPGTGAALRLLAQASRPRSVVEIGTGTGVSGLWLLYGMPTDAMLTSIDVEPEHQTLARQSFAAAGFGPSRFRLIVATARTMLPRLADGAYDVMFVDGAVLDYPYCVEAAYRILRPGGLLLVNNGFGEADEDAAQLRDAVDRLHDDPQWTSMLLPVGTGLVCATRTG